MLVFSSRELLCKCSEILWREKKKRTDLCVTHNKEQQLGGELSATESSQVIGMNVKEPEHVGDEQNETRFASRWASQGEASFDPAPSPVQSLPAALEVTAEAPKTRERAFKGTRGWGWANLPMMRWASGLFCSILISQRWQRESWQSPDAATLAEGARFNQALASLAEGPQGAHAGKKGLACDPGQPVKTDSNRPDSA